MSADDSNFLPEREALAAEGHVFKSDEELVRFRGTYEYTVFASQRLLAFSSLGVPRDVLTTAFVCRARAHLKRSPDLALKLLVEAQRKGYERDLSNEIRLLEGLLTSGRLRSEE